MRAAAGDHLKVVRYLVEERDTELHSAGRSSCITEEMLSIIIWKACDGIQTYGDVGRCTKGEGCTYVHGEHEISGTASHQLLLVEHLSPAFSAGCRKWFTRYEQIGRGLRIEGDLQIGDYAASINAGKVLEFISRADVADVLTWQGRRGAISVAWAG